MRFAVIFIYFFEPMQHVSCRKSAVHFAQFSHVIFYIFAICTKIQTKHTQPTNFHHFPNKTWKKKYFDFFR